MAPLVIEPCLIIFVFPHKHSVSQCLSGFSVLTKDRAIRRPKRIPDMSMLFVQCLILLELILGPDISRKPRIDWDWLAFGADAAAFSRGLARR